MHSEMLITAYDFKLVSPPCKPGAASWSLHITFSEDISDALPLLNAELERADYDHKSRNLVWKGNGKHYAFRPNEISVAPITDREQAPEYCREATDIVNGIWSRRDAIKPDYTRLELPTVMELYKKLPRNNCGECGFPACMAFAAACRSGKAVLTDCPELK